jgi:hypothetical protein
MAGDAEWAMGKPYTAQRRVTALIWGWPDCDTQNLYAAGIRLQSPIACPLGEILRFRRETQGFLHELARIDADERIKVV